MKKFAILALLIVVAGCTTRDMNLEGAYTSVNSRYNDSIISQEQLTTHKSLKIFKQGYCISVTYYATPKNRS
ncbi:MAG: hypothetical protein QM768_01595 [Agriterribacter sp.]